MLVNEVPRRTLTLGAGGHAEGRSLRVSRTVAAVLHAWGYQPGSWSSHAYFNLPAGLGNAKLLLKIRERPDRVLFPC